jgi:hypothetical protein
VVAWRVIGWSTRSRSLLARSRGVERRRKRKWLESAVGRRPASQFPGQPCQPAAVDSLSRACLACCCCYQTSWPTDTGPKGAHRVQVRALLNGSCSGGSYRALWRWSWSVSRRNRRSQGWRMAMVCLRMEAARQESKFLQRQTTADLEWDQNLSWSFGGMSSTGPPALGIGALTQN